MQPPGAVTKKGYTAVTQETKYATARGYGFTRLSGWHARDHGRLAPLVRDYLSAEQADFRVDVPDGVYDVWIQTGDSQADTGVENVYLNCQLLINGNTVFHDDTSPAYYFKHDFLKHYKDFWHPGMSYYDTFVAPHFHTYHFQARATNGRLDIGWRNLPMDGMIISPAADHAAVAREWAHLKVDQRQGAKIHERRDRAERMPKVTAADEARGFILFHRPANVEVYPTSRPKAGERIDLLKTFAAKGQTVAAHFSLLPVKDLGDVSIHPTALHRQGGVGGETSDGGGVIPADAVNVRVVRYIFYQIGEKNAPSYNYRIAPFVLDRHEYVPCPKGTTWTWWVNIKVPPHTPAGVYQGNLRIEPKNAPAFDFPMKLRVLGFELKPLPILQGYYYYPEEPWYYTYRDAHIMGATLRDDPAVLALIDQQERSTLAFMKSLGLNSVSLELPLTPFWTLRNGLPTLKENNAFVRWMDIYAQSGMGPMYYYNYQLYGVSNYLGRIFPKRYKTRFTPQWDQAYRHIPVYVNHIGEQRGWPKILWGVSDETSNHGKTAVEDAVRLAKLLRGLKGVTTIASMNGELGKMLVPYLDIAVPNWAFPFSKKNVKFIRDSGTKLWAYNCGSSRLTLGLWPWRLKLGGRFQWEWYEMQGDPWDDLDGAWGDHHYNMSIMSPHGPVGTLRTEALRAGITDHRYMATLEAAIAAAKSNPAMAAMVRQANDFLADVRRRIPVDLTKLVSHRVSPKEAGASLGGEFRDTDNLEHVRLTAARYIAELRG